MLGALRWADHHDPESYNLLAGSLSWFWASNSHYATAREFLEKVVTGSIGNRIALARAMTGYGILLSTGGDLERALDLLNRGLSLWRELKNRKEEALALEQISFALMYTSQDNEAVVEHAKEALTLAAETYDTKPPTLHLPLALVKATAIMDGFISALRGKIPDLEYDAVKFLYADYVVDNSKLKNTGFSLTYTDFRESMRELGERFARSQHDG